MVANSYRRNSHSSSTRRTVRSAGAGDAAGNGAGNRAGGRNGARNGARNGGSARRPYNQPYNRRSHRRIQKNFRTKHPILFWALIVVFTPIILGILTVAWMYVTTDIPQPDKIAMADKTKVYYADGKTEIGSFAEQNREIINCSVLKPYVGNAIIASENRSFYKDGGIDLKGIGRAIIHNVTSKGRWGGSTITQQYAERYYLGETKTYLGKLHEAILALKIAQTQDKNTVLCNYMNTIYLGRGAYGIQAAAKAYFGVEAKDLTLSQAAMLAGIIPAPSSWDPAIMPKEANIRFKRVLRIMREDKYITSEEYKNAKMPQTINQTKQNMYAGPQGYLLQMVRSELTSGGAFTKEDLDTGGYRIITTIDKAKQDLMFNVASPTAGARGITPQGVQTGAMSVNPKDGSIISVYAGDDYLSKPLNNATQALYEPGSTMKPFALIGAIQAGTSLNTLFNGNTGLKFKGIDKPVNNFANTNWGIINLYKATANSVNTPFMALQEKLGQKGVANTAVMAGLNAQRVNGKNPFTVLGNDPVHISEIARAYSTIANQGRRPDLHIVSSVKNPDGKEFYRAPTVGKQVFAAADMALAIKAMQGVVQYGTSPEVRGVGKPIAGKSGTANDASACSFVGFTPSVLTVFAIWHPDAQGNPLPVPTFRGYPGGIGYSAHLFTRYMRAALAGTAAEKFPEAKDNGKIGGVDGTWGLGGSKHEFADDDSEVANSENKEDSSSSKDKDKDKDKADSASGENGASSEDGANGSGANGENGSAGSGTTVGGGSAGDGSGAASSSGSGGANQTQSGGGD
ncbi:penicillin-binding protein [Gardnerella vaginalis]|uniref:Penicillin-binding protein n=1 Tax=Gardnerella piotii TaxID=2792977 RepID=A0ABU5MS63_9BIFI|nr:transglycosylase domain-containing protein [Gardnerella piotii]MDZ7545181.1 penicillin-binding protein [Gardnerella piotii]MDZ7552577.1 penicillin-binding protein [Gardnerella piotii]RFT24796.1 penicillin-binding protein [Gardnerella vaginalis]